MASTQRLASSVRPTSATFVQPYERPSTEQSFSASSSTEQPFSSTEQLSSSSSSVLPSSSSDRRRRRFESLYPTNDARFYEHCQTLNDDQLQFLNFLNDWNADRKTTVFLLSGGPGTGKTYAVVKTFDLLTNKTVRMAYTRKVAESIGGTTIHSLLQIDFKSSKEGSFEALTRPLRHEEGVTDVSEEEYLERCESVVARLCEIYRLRKSHEQDALEASVVVLDEVGMIPVWFLASIVRFFVGLKESRPRLFVLMGDENQLRPIGCDYNVFSFPAAARLLGAPIRTLYLTENNRFVREYHALVEEIEGAVRRKNLEELTALVRRRFPVRREIREDDFKTIEIVLAYKNDTIDRYNEAYLNFLPGRDLKIIKVLDGKPVAGSALRLKENCRVMTTANQHHLSNGTELVFVRYCSKKDVVWTRDPESGRAVPVYRSPVEGQFPLTAAFAVTIHRYQGQTIDKNNVLFDFDQSEDLQLVYTALSRVRSMDQIYGVMNLCNK